MRWLLLFAPACSFGARAAPTRDAPALGSDAALDAPTIDAPSTTCMAHWMAHTVRFQPPTAMLELNTPDYERDPYVTDDELRIFFSGVRSDSLPQFQQDIYTANRSETTDPFGPATKFTPASTDTGAEGKMSMTGDGTQLFVASDLTGNGSKGGVDVWFAAKTSATTWSPLGQGKSGSVNDSGGQYDPFVSDDGTALYLAPSSGLPQQIYVATRADETKSFGAPTEIMELADPGGAGTADPTLSADQRVIVFTSPRTGSIGLSDLWYATRDTATGTFGTPLLVPDVNSATYDGDAHLSHDGCTLYFDSIRNNPQANDWDLFVAHQQL